MDDQSVISLLKGLVIDGVDKANSGHPGGAMSSMDFAYLLFKDHLKYDPEDPTWMGRDRFILSAGHESMLMYSLLYGIGWLKKNDLMQFRQIGSKTAGHPENFLCPGVECTTGPLGQGAAMSVGFAIAGRHFAAQFGKDLFEQKNWVLLGDGCVQEGVTLGAASLAGHLQLSNLIWYYDKNNAQISGPISRSTSDNHKSLFAGLGWNVLSIDGHNHKEIQDAIKQAKEEKNRPTIIIAHTIMAKGAANLEGSHETHGSPFKPEERDATKAKLGIPEGEAFYWPEEARKTLCARWESLSEEVKQWKKLLQEKSKDQDFKELYERYFVPVNWDKIPFFEWDLAKPMASRVAFGKILEFWADKIPNLMGGSADLEPSNMTGGFAKKVGDFTCDEWKGRNISFGVREFPMSCITNGMALFGGLIPFDATFLAFADYSRPALRLGAIQRVGVLHEFSHDSFYLGEDGPTHQPIEQIASLRAMPNMYLMRPADPIETEAMMRVALDARSTPSSLCLSRQNLAYLPNSESKKGREHILAKASKGAWIVKEAGEDCLAVIYATGSEVSLALEVAIELEMLANKKEVIAVVSLPCIELFYQQEKSYQDSILMNDVKKRISIEAASSQGWERFVGREGLMISIDHYGESGTAKDLAQKFGFTTEVVVKKVKTYLGLQI